MSVHAGVSPARQKFIELDAISRQRRLTDEESDELAHAIRCIKQSDSRYRRGIRGKPGPKSKDKK